MKKAEAFEKVRAQIIELMQRDGVNWTKSWITTGAPCNFTTKKPYRGMNNFWLSIQGFESNEWGSFKQWSEAGYKIRKGSKANFVVFGEMRDKKESWLTPEERAKFKASGVLPKYFFWNVHSRMFNADQIEGYEAPSVVSNHSQELTAEGALLIDSFIKGTGAKIAQHGQPHYSPITDSIGMPNIRSFFSDVDYYSTLLHELTHWTGHKTRCNRDQSGTFGSEDYAREELVAEIGSAFLCRLHGVEKTVREDHAAYLNSWIEIIRESDSALSSAFTKAQEAVDFLDTKAQEVAA